MTKIYDSNNYRANDLVNFYNKIPPCGYYWSQDQILLESPVVSPLRSKWVNPLQEPVAEQKKKDRLPPAFMSFIHLVNDLADTWITPDAFIPFVNTYGLLTPPESNIDQHFIFYAVEYEDIRNAYKSMLQIQHNQLISLTGTLAFSDVATPDIDTMFTLLSTQKLLKKAPQLSYQEHPFEVDISGQGTLFRSKINELIISYEENITINSTDDFLALLPILRSDAKWSITIRPTTWPSDNNVTIMSSDIQDCLDIKSLNLIWLSHFVSSKAAKYPSAYSQKYNPKSQKWTPTVRPSSLLAAMWYQFGEWVAGYRKYKWCPFCSTWQDVTENKSSWEMHKDCASKARVQKSRENKKRKLMILAKKDDDE